MSDARRALVALVLISIVAGSAGRIDAATGSASSKCTIFTQSDAERFFHAPVVRIETPVDATECAYGLADKPSVGVVVTRESAPLYPPHAGSYGVSQVRHVKGVGQDAYTYYANAGAGGIYTADILTSKGVTSVTIPEKAGNAAAALAIARAVMNR